MRLFFQSAVAIFFSISTATAEQALHVVGIYEGRERTGKTIHGSRADVVIDRPGEEVTLVLTAYEATRWTVTIEDGSTVERIVLGGYGAARSEVYVSTDDDYALFLGASIRSDIPYNYREDGPAYRQIVTELPATLGFESISTFQGSYRAQDIPFSIDRDTNIPISQDPDYLALYLANSEVVPIELRDFLRYEPSQSSSLRFSNDVLTWSPSDGPPKSFPVSLDVPRISGGAGIYVEAENAIYWVTWSGEGFLYRLDVRTGRWRVVRSMLQEDANSMIYDPEGRRMLMPGGFPNFKGVWIEDLVGGTTFVPISAEALVGLTDFYDRGNGPAPYVRALAVQGNTLLVVADGRGTFQREVSGTAAFRIWQIDLADGSVQLVSYRN